MQPAAAVPYCTRNAVSSRKASRSPAGLVERELEKKFFAWQVYGCLLSVFFFASAPSIAPRRSGKYGFQDSGCLAEESDLRGVRRPTGHQDSAGQSSLPGNSTRNVRLHYDWFGEP